MKPIFIIFNDAHLKGGNEEDTIASVRHMIRYALDNDIKFAVFAGDLFHSRSNQKESVLQACDTILEMFHSAGIFLYIFPGNHDKTDYKSYTSFLDVYRFHPGIQFNDRPKKIEIEGVSVMMIPFFDDSILVPMLEEAEGADILISHFEMAGSNHLGKVSEKGTITRKTLKKWKKTYLGHYHNTHEITKNIVHLPSLRQQDFGEDDNKGFSVIFDDLSYEIVKGVFKRFKKISIDVDKLDAKAIDKLIEDNKNSLDSIRIELVGEESKIKAIDKSRFKDAGIDLKTKFTDSDINIDRPAPKLIQKFDKKKVEDIFKDFCAEKGYDYEVGNKILQQYLNK